MSENQSPVGARQGDDCGFAAFPCTLLGGLNSRDFLSLSSGGRGSRIRVSEGLFPSGTSRWFAGLAVSSHGPPSCVSRS